MKNTLSKTPTADVRSVEIRNTHAAARQHAELAVAFATRCGMLCLQVKNDLPHGSFLPWLEQNVPEMSEQTARNYMRLAENLLLQDGSMENDDDVIDIESSRVGKMLMDDKFTDKIASSEKYRSSIVDMMRAVTDGKTLSQLYLDFGIVKGKKPVPEAEEESDDEATEAVAPQKPQNQQQIAREYWFGSDSGIPMVGSLFSKIKNQAETEDTIFMHWSYLSGEDLLLIQDVLEKLTNRIKPITKRIR